MPALHRAGAEHGGQPLRLPAGHVLVSREHPAHHGLAGTCAAGRASVRGRRRVAARRTGGAPCLGGLGSLVRRHRLRHHHQLRAACRPCACWPPSASIWSHSASRRRRYGRGRARKSCAPLSPGVVLLVAAEQWPARARWPQRLAAARPTIHVAGLDRLRARLEPADLVACTDELACLLMVDRVDRWLALDDFVRERFLVDAERTCVGVYSRRASRVQTGPPLLSVLHAASAGPRPRRRRVQGVPGRETPAAGCHVPSRPTSPSTREPAAHLAGASHRSQQEVGTGTQGTGNEEAGRSSRELRAETRTGRWRSPVSSPAM